MRYGKDLEVVCVVMEDENLKRNTKLVTVALENITSSLPQPMDKIKLKELADIWGVSVGLAKQMLREDYVFVKKSAKELEAIHGRIDVQGKREPISTCYQTVSWLLESLDNIEV